MQRDAAGTAVVDGNTGVSIQAMADGPLDANHNWATYAIGDFTPNGGGMGPDNLLYKLDMNGNADADPWLGSVTPRAMGIGGSQEGTNIVPLAQLTTAPTILAQAATQAVGPYNAAPPYSDVNGGNTFTVSMGGIRTHSSSIAASTWK